MSLTSCLHSCIVLSRYFGLTPSSTSWNIILIDHSRAFVEKETPFLDQITAVDRPFYEALKALDEATVSERLGPWLFGKGSVKDLLGRRDEVVAKLEKLAVERGEAAVFPR